MSKEVSPRLHERYSNGKRRVQHAVATSAALFGLFAGAAVVSENTNIDHQVYASATSTAASEQMQVTADVAHVDRAFHESQRPTEGAGTEAWVDYFDAHWQSENLPREWHNLKSQQSNKRVGFIMNSQMALLQDPINRPSISEWAQKTKRDLEGFKLEFLSDHVVYPRKYHRSKEDPTRLEDPLYGKSTEKEGAYADIEEIISPQERNGSVKQSVGEIKKFLLNAPDGAVAVMTSPLGPTGFKTDDGLAIDYPDSYFFIMQKQGDAVMNYTIKTSFSLKECREAIYRLTGKRLPEGSLLETYVKTVAKVDPEKPGEINNIADVLSVLQDIHPGYAFSDPQNDQKTTWDEVRTDIAKGEELYQFDRRTHLVLDDFSRFCEDETRSRLDYQKGVAATILRMGDIFFQPNKHGVPIEVPVVANTWTTVHRPQQSFGAVLEKTAERRGCSGGGSGSSMTVTTLGGERSATAGGESKWFTCSECGWQADGEIGNKPCGGCGFTKADYAKKYGVVCE